MVAAVMDAAVHTFYLKDSTSSKKLTMKAEVVSYVVIADEEQQQLTELTMMDDVDSVGADDVDLNVVIHLVLLMVIEIYDEIP